MGRSARSRRRCLHRESGEARRRNGVAGFLRRHDGAGTARRYQSSAPCDEIFALVLDDLRDALRYRLDCRGRCQAWHRHARSGAAQRPGGDLGRQSGQHAGQRDAACDGGEEARRQARGGRSLPHGNSRKGRSASGIASGDGWGPRLRCHACTVCRGLRRLGLHVATPIAPTIWRRTCRPALPNGRRQLRACPRPRSSSSHDCMAATNAASFVAITVSRARAMARRICMQQRVCPQ